jgi:hypothetical protein
VHLVVSTTPTQYALAICFLIIGPVFGIGAAIVEWRRERSVVSGAIVTTFASWVAWVAACVCAKALFPDYPSSGRPAEPVAMLFTLPGLLTGAFVIATRARRAPPVRGSARSAGVICGISLLVAAGLAVVLVIAERALTMYPARRELPSSAVILREETYEDTFLGDFTHELEARMSPEEFRAWMRRLDMHEVSDAPLRFEAEGSSDSGCGAHGVYEDRVGRFRSWCS